MIYVNKLWQITLLFTITLSCADPKQSPGGEGTQQRVEQFNH